METTLQPTYTAAAYFLFKGGVVRDILNQSTKTQTVLGFTANVQDVDVYAYIPWLNVSLTLSGCVLLIAVVFTVVMWPLLTTRPDPLERIAEAHTIANVLLNERAYPPLLVSRTIADTNETDDATDADKLMIQALSLLRKDEQDREAREWRLRIDVGAVIRFFIVEDRNVGPHAELAACNAVGYSSRVTRGTQTGERTPICQSGGTSCSASGSGTSNQKLTTSNSLARAAAIVRRWIVHDSAGPNREDDLLVIRVAIQRGRLLFLTAMAVVFVAALVLVFSHRGVVIETFERKSMPIPKQEKLLEKYNSYSGTITALLGRPVEIYVDLVVQGVVLRLMAD